MKATKEELIKDLPTSDIRVLEIRKKRLSAIVMKIDEAGKISVTMHEQWRAMLAGVEQDVEGVVLTEIKDLDYHVKDLYDTIANQAMTQ